MREVHKAAIIIVNWNGKKFLENCLTAVANQTYKNFNIYLVDNGSNDGSVIYVKKYFPSVKVIALKENTGFAEGSNIGIREALKDNRVKYIVCLNNDTLVDKNWLKSLIITAGKEQKIGMVASKALLPDGRIQNAGLALERGFRCNKLGGISLGYGQKKVLSLEQEVEIFAPGGEAALYKKEMLDEIGLFDEDYFAYDEDTDLGLRARLAGWKCCLSPKAKLIHYDSQTGGSFSPFKLFHKERNRYYTVLKNLPLKFLIKFFYYDIVTRVGQVLTYKEKIPIHMKTTLTKKRLLKIYIKVYLSLIKNLPKIIKKRKIIQQNIAVDSSTIEQWFEKFSRKAIEG
jgi:hypothetical protein